MSLCDICGKPAVDLIGGEVYYCENHEDAAVILYDTSPQREAEIRGMEG